VVPLWPKARKVHDSVQKVGFEVSVVIVDVKLLVANVADDLHEHVAAVVVVVGIGQEEEDVVDVGAVIAGGKVRVAEAVHVVVLLHVENVLECLLLEVVAQMSHQHLLADEFEAAEVADVDSQQMLLEVFLVVGKREGLVA
jgi:hypothetical protein